MQRFFSPLFLLIVFLSLLQLSCVSKTNDSHLLSNIVYGDVLALDYRQPDLVFEYGVGSTRDNYINYYPSTRSVTKGVLVNIHGGCWLSSFDMSHSRAYASALASHGYEVYNVEYRRSGNGGEWPQALEDVLLAMKIIFAQIEHEGWPMIYLTGHSAGGHLALLAAEKLKRADIQVIALAPITDVAAYSQGQNTCQTATPQFMQGRYDENTLGYEDAQVVNKDFSFGLRPIILIGSEDKIVQAIYSQHPQANVVMIKDAGHFDFIHSGTRAFHQLVQLLKPS